MCILSIIFQTSQGTEDEIFGEQANDSRPSSTNGREQASELHKGNRSLSDTFATNTTTEGHRYSHFPWWEARERAYEAKYSSFGENGETFDSRRQGGEKVLNRGEEMGWDDRSCTDEHLGLTENWNSPGLFLCQPAPRREVEEQHSSGIHLPSTDKGTTFFYKVGPPYSQVKDE